MAASLTFGDMLRQHRLAAGLTQEALAERAGLSEHGIQKLERGVTRPYPDTLQRLVGALRLSEDDQAELRKLAGATPRSPRVLADGVAAHHNLPIPVTSFIGREQEVGETVERLTNTRLLTLTGIGGCGKTRLALEVSRSMLERYPDGVWLVELAPVADSALVPHLIAKAVGVPEATNQTVTSALIQALQHRHLLLVLDNCEHLDYGDRTLLAHLMEGLSGLGSALGEHERAVRLRGAAEALRETAGAPLHPAWRSLAEPWLAISLQALGKDAASVAWAAGRSLPIERVLEGAAQPIKRQENPAWPT